MKVDIITMRIVKLVAKETRSNGQDEFIGAKTSIRFDSIRGPIFPPENRYHDQLDGSDNEFQVSNESSRFRELHLTLSRYLLTFVPSSLINNSPLPPIERIKP